MPVNVLQRRVETGVFEKLCSIRHTTKFLIQVTRLQKKLLFSFIITVYSRDIELKTGPNKTNSICKFSLCDWNLNSLATNNFEKVGLLEAYNTINKFDTNCVSQSYLDSKC